MELAFDNTLMMVFGNAQILMIFAIHFECGNQMADVLICLGRGFDKMCALANVYQIKSRKR